MTVHVSNPAFVHDLASLRLRPPVAPATILNAAVNYVEHANEMAGAATAAAANRPAPAAPQPPS